MRNESIFDFLGDEANLKIIGLILSFVIIAIAIYFAKRNANKMTSSWSEVAALNGLEFSTQGFSYNYGLLLGSHGFDYPGLGGSYRGRAIQIQTSPSRTVADSGTWVLEAAIILASPKPYSALAYKRPFEDFVKKRIQKDSKTANHEIDAHFKIRSEDTAFLAYVLERVNLATWLKQEKYKTAHLVFSDDTLLFRGAVTSYSVSPEQAMSLLNILCDIADSAR